MNYQHLFTMVTDLLVNDRVKHFRGYLTVRSATAKMHFSNISADASLTPSWSKYCLVKRGSHAWTTCPKLLHHNSLRGSSNLHAHWQGLKPVSHVITHWAVEDSLWGIWLNFCRNGNTYCMDSLMRSGWGPMFPLSCVGARPHAQAPMTPAQWTSQVGTF